MTACCKMCPGRHTRTCEERRRGEARDAVNTVATSTAGSSTAAAGSSSHQAPANGQVSVQQVERAALQCCVCFETAGVSLTMCRHPLCDSCRTQMRASSMSRCPICRGPLPELEDIQVYVMLHGTGTLFEHLGYHRNTLTVLERRFQIHPLGADILDHGEDLRRVAGFDQASMWWRQHHDTQMPRRH